MTWLKADDKLDGHPKLLGLSLSAVGLYFKGAIWSAKHETDGYIPRAQVPSLAAPYRYPFNLADVLVKAKLWDPVGRDGFIARVRSDRHVKGPLYRTEGDGFQIHDFLDDNPSAAHLEERRLDHKKRKQESRERHRTEVPDDGLPDGSHTAPDHLPYGSRAKARAAEPHGRNQQVVDEQEDGLECPAMTPPVTITDVTTARPDPTYKSKATTTASPADAGAPDPSFVKALVKDFPNPTVVAPKPRGHEAVRAYCDAWKLQYGSNPTVTGRVAGILRRLHGTIGADTFAVVLKNYFRTTDAFVIRQRHPAGLLESQVDRWRSDEGTAAPTLTTFRTRNNLRVLENAERMAEQEAREQGQITQGGAR